MPERRKKLLKRRKDPKDEKIDELNDKLREIDGGI